MLTNERRYRIICKLAARYFKDSGLTSQKPWGLSDERLTLEFLLEASRYSHPKVFDSFPVHLMASSIMAGKIAKILDSPELRPTEARVLLLLHDIGSLIDPGVYLEKDLVGQRILFKSGVAQKYIEKLPDIKGILGLTRHPIEDINDISLPQIVIDVSDNLGKPKKSGRLPTLNEIVVYARSQPARYSLVKPVGKWTLLGIKKLKAGRQKNAIKLLKEEVLFLKKKGVDFGILREEVAKEMGKRENKEWIKKFQKARL